MVYSFDMDEAVKYGTNAAIILYNFRFWLTKNKANEKNIHDGRVWTYNSVAAFQKLFPNMTYKQIRTALEKLENEGVLVTDNFNKFGYDKTKWYSINESAFVVEPLKTDNCPERQMSDTNNCPGGQTDLPYKADRIAIEGEPIPNSKPDENTNIYKEIIEYLNLKANTKYKHTTKATKDLINARINDEYTLEDFKTVIDNKCTSWLNTEFEKFLRPQTLFSNKFEGYLNEKPKYKTNKSVVNFEDYID